MSKVQVTADGLRALYEHAKSAGTIGAWADVALEWADKAERELIRLKAIVEAAGNYAVARASGVLELEEEHWPKLVKLLNAEAAEAAKGDSDAK